VYLVFVWPRGLQKVQASLLWQWVSETGFLVDSCFLWWCSDLDMQSVSFLCIKQGLSPLSGRKGGHTSFLLEVGVCI